MSAKVNDLQVIPYDKDIIGKLSHMLLRIFTHSYKLLTDYIPNILPMFEVVWVRVDEKPFWPALIVPEPYYGGYLRRIGEEI